MHLYLLDRHGELVMNINRGCDDKMQDFDLSELS
jgi:hypothetical protein